MKDVLEEFYLVLHPRPAYLIGSGRVGEAVNFMAASWVTPVSEEPPRVAVAIGVDSYTHELMKQYREFTSMCIHWRRWMCYTRVGASAVGRWIKSLSWG